MLGRPLREVMFAAAGTAEAELLDQTRYTQPALFAVEVALFRLLRSLGRAPGPAHRPLDRRARRRPRRRRPVPAGRRALVAARGRLMQALPPGGAMIAIAAAEQDVAATLPAGAGIAAVNGPAAVVVSGDDEPGRAPSPRTGPPGAQDPAAGQPRLPLRPHGPDARAASPQAAATLTYHPPQIPVISTVTGQPADPAS